MFKETADIETSSSQYAQRFSGEVGRWFLERQLSFSERLLNLTAPAKILDIGGGHGQLANPLSNNGHSVTVIGSDDSCSHLLSQNVSFVKGDLVSLPFDDASFDVVMCFRFISHCHQWKKLIYEATRVSKKLVLLEYPVYMSINALSPLFFSLKKKIEKDTRTFTLFSHTKIRREFEAQKFHHVKSLGQYVAPMALHRAVKNKKFSEGLESALHCATQGHFASPVISLFERTTTPDT